MIRRAEISLSLSGNVGSGGKGLEGLCLFQLLIACICITTEILFTEFIGVIKSHLSYTETRPLLLLVKQVFLFLFCIFLVLLVCRGFRVII